MMRKLFPVVTLCLAAAALASAQEQEATPPAQAEVQQEEAVSSEPVERPKPPRREGRSRPPQPLHKVGDHWTPYNPPTEFPPGANVHIIKPGDTLWDLARQYLKDPYLWPQIWEKNTYITDAHWIYPGDPLLIDGRAETTTETVTETTTTAEGQASDSLESAQVITGIPVALGGEDDIYCFGYLAPEPEVFPFEIAGAEEEKFKVGFSIDDIVYINGGSDHAVTAGQEFFIVEDRGSVSYRNELDVAEGPEIGHYMAYLGRLRIICTQQNSATAEIVQACDAVVIGSKLKPFEPQPVPLAARTATPFFCNAANGKVQGQIVESKDRQATVMQGNVIFIDKGSDDRLVPGDFLLIWRDGVAEGLPRVVLGEGAVLTVTPKTATVKILESRYPMIIGDRLELK